MRISGVEERDINETWEQTAAKVTSLLGDKMKLSSVVLERAHRVGPLRDNIPCTIVARFARKSDCDAVMRGGSKNAARTQGKVAFFWHTKLIIRMKMNEGADGRGQRSTVGVGAIGGRSVGGAAATAAGGDAAAAGDATAPGVVCVEVAEVRSWGDDARLPLPSSQPGGSRVHPVSSSSASAPVVPQPQRKEGKLLRVRQKNEYITPSSSISGQYNCDIMDIEHLPFCNLRNE